MSELLLRGGRVVLTPGRPARRADLRVAGGRVVEVGPGLRPAGEPAADVTGLTLTPGLVDLQVNGAVGVDLTADPARLPVVAAAMARHGVTAFLPTLVTSPPERLEDVLGEWPAMARRLGQGSDAPAAGACPLGWHIEGPMLAHAARGAHDPRWLRPPSPVLVDGWSPRAGVLMATVAPELPGAVEVVRLLAARGVIVSLGHTSASLAEVTAAVEAGASTLTHLYNAMPPLGHRAPGPVGAALGGAVLTAGVIVDGLHVDPIVVALTWRALGGDRFLAVSDTTAALDLPPGPAVLGDLAVVVGADQSVRLADDPATLAGSAIGLDECVRRLASYTGQPHTGALRAATTVPARLLGRDDLGHLRVGARGDVAGWDPAGRVVMTVVGGQLVVDARDGARDGTVEV